MTPAVASDNDIIPQFTMEQVPVSCVLDQYKKFDGRELIIATNIDRLSAEISCGETGELTNSDILRIMERALREQAGVVITPLDDKRLSVTYNEALMTAAAEPETVAAETPVPFGFLFLQMQFLAAVASIVTGGAIAVVFLLVRCCAS